MSHKFIKYILPTFLTCLTALTDKMEVQTVIQYQPNIIPLSFRSNLSTIEIQKFKEEIYKFIHQESLQVLTWINFDTEGFDNDMGFNINSDWLSGVVGFFYMRFFLRILNPIGSD